MARTRRQRWVSGPEGEFHLQTGRERTCRPGCGVCDKPRKRLDRRRQRHTRLAAIADQLR